MSRQHWAGAKTFQATRRPVRQDNAPAASSLLRRQKDNGCLGRQHPESQGLLQIQFDGGAGMAGITDGDVLADIQRKITAAGGEYEPAFNGRCPDDSAIHHTLDMVQERIPVVAAATGQGVGLRPQHESIRAIDAGETQLAHRLRDRIRITPGIGRQGQRRIAAALTDPLDPGRSVAFENGAVLGKSDCPRRVLDGRPV